MANRTLFASLRGKQTPATDTRNEAGGQAYSLTPHQAVAQFAATGCLNGTFYAGATEQLDEVLRHVTSVAAAEPKFIAQTAIYARQQGHMKDMPALLLAMLTVEHGELCELAFDRVIDSSRMLRNFVQILRSGSVGRKSLGSRPKRMVQRWLNSRAAETLFRQSVGTDPSLADIVRMVHPKPPTPQHREFFASLLGRPHQSQLLPQIMQDLEAWLLDPTRPLPDVPFQMLTSRALDQAAWTTVARRASWQQTRMNLNTFLRHGVFEDDAMTRLVAERLSNRELIANARAFPYQLMCAYSQVRLTMPTLIVDALHDAMEIATANVPNFAGKVHVAIDISGSMHTPVSGFRKGATTQVHCIDVAAMFAAAILRQNPSATILPFHTRLQPARLNRRDSIATLATTLAALPSGGTDCSVPLRHLNKRRSKGNLVIYLSDNESWANESQGRGTALLREWRTFSARNPHAKLVCLDLAPYGSSQVRSEGNILNIGGFSDRVFSVIDAFAQPGTVDTDHWVNTIRQVAI